MPLSDDDLILHVQRGDRAAYMKLFERHYPRIERFARRQLHDAEAGRDVASETFLRAYRSVDSFRVGEQITYLGYLFLICRRLILNERRRRNAHTQVSWQDVEATLPANLSESRDIETLPLGSLLETERRHKVREALGALSADDREIILLAFEEGLSRRDIAEILNKPSITAVTSHLHRAMQKLRATLQQQGYFSLNPEIERSAR